MVVAPIILKLIRRWFSGAIIMLRFIIIKIPYAPSFRRIPAKIIDPATGASTWALGSHWCRVYTGNFTKNAPIISRVSFWFKGSVMEGRMILRELLEFIIMKRAMRRGTEAVRVYINMYIVADTRSGCGPQYIISAAVGISVVSKAM